jgi:hypothetical protein
MDIENYIQNINKRVCRINLINENNYPFNFVPQIKPKDIIFEEKNPFILNIEESETNNSSFQDTYEIIKSHSFDNQINQKKQINTILSKLKKRNENNN